MLGRRVDALKRYRELGHLASDIDNRAALPFKASHRAPTPVYDSPKIDVEQPTLVGHWNIGELAVDGQARVVDPRIDGAELALRGIGQPVHRLLIRYVPRDGDGTSAVCTNLIGDLLQVRVVSRIEHDARAALRGETCWC